jgi:hypothetical protein
MLGWIERATILSQALPSTLACLAGAFPSKCALPDTSHAAPVLSAINVAFTYALQTDLNRWNSCKACE